MGEVWRAEHHLLARPAAIKLIRKAEEDAIATSPGTCGRASNARRK